LAKIKPPRDQYAHVVFVLILPSSGAT